MESVEISHSGDIGDVCYLGSALSHVGRPIDLRLTPHAMTRALMTPESAENLASLFREQPYIRSCEYAKHPSEHNADIFRGFIPIMDGYTNLASIMRKTFRLLPCDDEIPWLTARPLATMPVLIHRSPRYQNDKFPWQRVFEKYAGKIGVLGSIEEHLAMCDLANLPLLPHVPTRNMRILADCLAGCQLFIGNQSCPMAVAEGLKMRLVQEVSPQQANCRFCRSGATYGWGENVKLPEIA